MSRMLARAAVATVLALSLLSLSSCQSGLLSCLKGSACSPFGGFFGGKRLMLDRAFRGPDVVAVSHAVATNTVLNNRSRPVTHSIGRRCLTLHECRSLALRNSIELEEARIEQLIQRQIMESNKRKMLPHVVFSGELSNRDNMPYTYSEILGQEGLAPEPGTGGTGVNQFSTGRERDTWRYVLEARWSPTDAALAYYLTRSSRNDEVKQHYIRVRIAQRLLGVVDSSFHRLLSLQEAIPEAQKLVAKRKALAKKVRNLLEEKLVPVENYHKIRKKVIGSERLFQRLRNEAEQQRNLLASAMNLSPEYCADGGFYLAGKLKPPTYHPTICNLEMIAISNRPEAYRAGLDHLNSRNDLKRTIVKYFPKVTGFWRYTRDKDLHLYNKDWKEAGALVYLDLVDWYSNLSESRATRLMTDKTQREIGAVAMGITSQVRQAALKYYDALDQLKSSDESLQASNMVLRVQRERTEREAQEKLALEEAEADVLEEQIEKIRATGEAQGMLSELESAIGSNYNEPLRR